MKRTKDLIKQLFFTAIAVIVLFSCKKKEDINIVKPIELNRTANVLHIQGDLRGHFTTEPEDFRFGRDAKIEVDSFGASINNIFRSYFRRSRQGTYFKMQYLSKQPLLVADSLKRYWRMRYYEPQYDRKHFHFQFSINKELLSTPLFEIHSFEPEYYHEIISLDQGTKLLVSSHDSILTNVVQSVNSYLLNNLSSQRFLMGL